MATYTEHGLGNSASQEDIENLMVQKSRELFQLCDKEGKGFITKQDMLRLETEVTMTSEQLEAVFDSLDNNANGYLTVDEFTNGFGNYLGLEYSSLSANGKFSEISNRSSTKVYENEQSQMTDSEEEKFNQLFHNLQGQGLFEDVDVLKSLWSRIRQEEPELLGNFEDFLLRVTNELKRTHTNYHSLESSLRNKSTAHDEEVRKLYDEMENQIKLERERIIAEVQMAFGDSKSSLPLLEKAKEKHFRDNMESEILEKDKQLQSLLAGHSQIKQKLQHLNNQDVETKQENEKLLKEKEELEELLNQSQLNLEESRRYINEMKQKHREEKKDRAMAALQISEGIALERESLVKQLDMLRDMNRRLRDDQDEAELKRDDMADGMALCLVDNKRYRSMRYDDTSTSEAVSDVPVSYTLARSGSGRIRTNFRQRILNKGSVLPNYISSPRCRREELVRRRAGMSDGSEESPFDETEEDDIECDDTLLRLDLGLNSMLVSSPLTEQNASSNTNPATHTSLACQTTDGGNDSAAERYRPSRKLTEVSACEADDELEMETVQTRRTGSKKFKRPVMLDKGTEVTSSQTREQPVGSSVVTDVSDVYKDNVLNSPARVFKVVFVGDSGVGKSSFIHRFCRNDFKPSFSATIGVDFQVKTLAVDGHNVALQLWDTAGQERFRSITKQYFRKADGVVVLYDVTSESSFKNVRNWMTSVHEGTGEGTVLAIIGNKSDLLKKNRRVVTTKDGVKLADEYGGLFYETSAMTGANVREALHAMASLLKDKEDREMAKSLNLTDETVKKGCCS